MAQLAAKALTALVAACLGVAFGRSWRAQAIRNVPRISIDELKVLMEQKAVLVIDVRDPESFAKGRIPGAVNIDYTQVLRGAAVRRREADHRRLLRLRERDDGRARRGRSCGERHPGREGAQGRLG